MKKILWFLILFMPFIYGMENRKRKSSKTKPQKKELKFISITVEEDEIQKRRKLIHVPQKNDKTQKGLKFVDETPEKPCMDLTQEDDATQEEFLRAAVISNDIFEVKELLEEKVSPDINIHLPGSPAKSLVIYAIEKGYNEIAKLLHDKCTRPNANELLYIAIIGDNIEIINYLLHAGIPPNAPSTSINKNNTLLELAIKKGYNNIATLLIQQGADYSPENLLKVAIEGNNLEYIKHLLAFEIIDLNTKICDEEITFVAYAIKKGFMDAAQLLISAGAPIEAELTDTTENSEPEVFELFNADSLPAQIHNKLLREISSAYIPSIEGMKRILRSIRGLSTKTIHKFILRCLEKRNATTIKKLSFCLLIIKFQLI